MQVCDPPACQLDGAFRSDPRHCEAHQHSWRTIPKPYAGFNHTCERAYRSVLTVLDTAAWTIACSAPIAFAPPEGFWQCVQGWRGKWDVQYVHALVLSEDGAHAFVGVEFENRCPAVVRVGLLELAALVDATLDGAGMLGS